ncbi:transposase, partial [Bordetella pertussis]
PERVIIDCLAGDAVARTVDAMARALPD